VKYQLPRILTTRTPLNLIAIMKDVGFPVGLLSHPGMLESVLLRQAGACQRF
jgi:hypothetical protein